MSSNLASVSTLNDISLNTSFLANCSSAFASTSLLVSMPDVPMYEASVVEQMQIDSAAKQPQSLHENLVTSSPRLTSSLPILAAACSPDPESPENNHQVARASPRKKLKLREPKKPHHHGRLSVERLPATTESEKHKVANVKSGRKATVFNRFHDLCSIVGMRGLVVLLDKASIEVRYSDQDMQVKTEETLSELFNYDTKPLKRDVGLMCELVKAKPLTLFKRSNKQHTEFVYDLIDLSE